MADEYDDFVLEEDPTSAEGGDRASEEVSDDTEALFAQKLKKVKNALKKCEAEKQEYLDGWQRAKAEFANLRKQDETRHAERSKYAEQGLVEDLIPVLDSFDMAMGNKDAWEKAPEEWRKGIEHIHAGLLQKLQSRGLVKIESEGRTFDPELHEAVQNVPVDSEKLDHTVVSVLQAGYKLHDRVIRHAKVQVGVFEG